MIDRSTRVTRTPRQLLHDLVGASCAVSSAVPEGADEGGHCGPFDGLQTVQVDRTKSRRALEDLRNDPELRRAHRISNLELNLLSRVALMGEARCADDFVFVLNVLRATANR
jgi:hypothetical protein